MQAVTSQLEVLINEYTPKLEDVPENEFSFKPSPNKWSKKEILGHLIDSAQNNIRRFVTAQYLDKPHIVYNQDAWVAAQGYKSYDKQVLILLWQLLNKHICVILANMPQEAYARLCDTGKDGEKLYTIQYLAEDYITHHIHHLKQIFNN